MTKTRVQTVTCPNCKVEMYSRAHHDYRACPSPCKKTTVDGGFEYLHMGFDAKGPRPKTRFRFVNATRSELYNDWNHHREKFGIIKPK